MQPLQKSTSAQKSASAMFSRMYHNDSPSLPIGQFIEGILKSARDRAGDIRLAAIVNIHDKKITPELKARGITKVLHARYIWPNSVMLVSDDNDAEFELHSEAELGA